MRSVRPGTNGAQSGFTTVARLFLALLLVLLAAVPAGAETPAVTLAPLPGQDACLSDSAGDTACTPLRRELYESLGFWLSGDGRHAYALSWGYGYPASIHLFTRNRFDGALTEEDDCWSTEARPECHVDPLLEDAADLIISPDWRYVYVVGTPTPQNGDDNGMPVMPPPPRAILVFERNPSSGGLTRIQCLTAGDLPGCEPVGDLGEFLSQSIMSPDGRHAYIGTSVFDRDPGTGRLSGYRCAYEPTPDDSCPEGGTREISPDGRFVYEGGHQLTTYARDPASGALTGVACPDEQECRPSPEEVPFGGTYTGLTVAPDGRNLYATDWFPEEEAWVYDMDADPGTGLVSQRGCFHVGELDSSCAPVPALEFPGSPSAAPDGQAVYEPYSTWVNDEGGLIMFSRDPVSGRLTWAGCMTHSGSGGECVQAPMLGSSGLAVVSPDSRNVYLVSGGGRISVLGLAVDVRAGALHVSHRGTVRPRLICPTGVSRCEGQISLKRRRVRLAKKHFSIPGGGTTRVRVHLSKKGLAKIQKKPRLRTNATLTAAAVPGRTVRSVKLRRR